LLIWEIFLKCLRGLNLYSYLSHIFQLTIEVLSKELLWVPDAVKIDGESEYFHAFWDFSENNKKRESELN
jgi:hypothetical protein